MSPSVRLFACFPVYRYQNKSHAKKFGSESMPQASVTTDYYKGYDSANTSR